MLAKNFKDVTAKEAHRIAILHWLYDNIEAVDRVGEDGGKFGDKHETAGYRASGKDCALCRKHRSCKGCVLIKYGFECNDPLVLERTPYESASTWCEDTERLIRPLEAQWNMADVLLYTYLSEYGKMPDLTDDRKDIHRY